MQLDWASFLPDKASVSRGQRRGGGRGQDPCMDSVHWASSINISGLHKDVPAQ